MHLDQAETLLREMSEEHSLGLLYWGLAMTDLEAMRVSEARAASQKAMDIFARLGEREFWARAACNHSQHLMVKGKLARATALIDEISRAAAGFVSPDDFGEVSWFMRVFFWFAMKAPRQAMRYFRLGLQRPGQHKSAGGIARLPCDLRSAGRESEGSEATRGGEFCEPHGSSTKRKTEAAPAIGLKS